MPTTTDRPDSVVVWKSPKNGEFYVRRIAPNGKILMHSEGYRQRRSAEAAAQRHARAAVVVE